MANKLNVLNKYRPKIKLIPTADTKNLVEFLHGRTGINKGELLYVLYEISDAIKFYFRNGQGLKLEGLGTFLPEVNLKGEFNISHRLDVSIKQIINAPGYFKGELENRRNIGKGIDELCELWNKEFPHDLAE